MKTVREDVLLTDWAVRLSSAVLPLARHLRQQIGDGSFTPTQMSVLGAINRHGPITVGDLAMRERLSTPSISKVVSALENAGIIERIADERDRRICFVRVTTNGHRWIDANRSARNAWLAEQISILLPHERAVLAAAIPVLERLLGGD